MARAFNPLTGPMAFPDFGTKFNNIRARVVANQIQRFAREPHGWGWLQQESTNPNHVNQPIPAEHEPEVDNA